MPSTPQRGFIVRPTQDNTEPVAEPEFESVNIQVGPDHYSFTREEVVSTGRWGTPVSLGTGILQLVATPHLPVETTSSLVNE